MVVFIFISLMTNDADHFLMCSMANVNFNIGYGWFSTQRNNPLFRGPHMSAQRCDTHPEFETHQLLISTLLGWKEQIPKKEAEGQRFMPLSLFSLFPVSCSWVSPGTNSLRQILHQTINSGGQMKNFVVKSLGQTSQSFLCQVSMNRGRSHPLLTSHP